MKTLKLIIPVAAMLLFAGQAAAQDQEAAKAAQERQKEEAMRAAEEREAVVARKMEEAERKMAEAAREIAELTADRLPQLRQIERRIEILSSDRPRLGVTIGDKDDKGPVEGVRIMAVTPGSAAS
jgi:hypothetical protein